MSTGMEGLRTDQAPPLAIPGAFFLTAPMALVAAGVLALVAGPDGLSTRWSPPILAITHLFTLGYLGSIMLGAMYQVVPVVAGVPVPGARAAHAVLAGWIGGVTALVAAFLTGDPHGFVVAAALLAAAALGFALPVAVALAHAPSRTPTVLGMKVAMIAFALVVTVGLALAGRRAGLPLPAVDFLALVDGHAAVGTLVWVGGLLSAVSWQVVPMFYLAPAPPTWSTRPAVVLIATTLAAIPGVVLLGGSPLAVAVAAVPALGVVWVVHPAVTIRAIVGRKRKRADYSLRFWLAGLAFAGLAAGLVPVAWAWEPRGVLLLGWTAAFGWAGLVTHGMLSRIVPFLVWFHRFSPLVGRVRVPSMRELLPESRLGPALALHGATVVVGLLGIATGIAGILGVAAVLLIATGVALEVNLARTLLRRPAG